MVVVTGMQWVGELAATMAATKAENWDILTASGLVEVLAGLSVADLVERMEPETALTKADRWVSLTVAKMVDQWESSLVGMSAATMAVTLGEEKA
jgi:hypothetical protein